MIKQKLTLEQINALGLDAFVEHLGSVFEHSPWFAEATWTKRPFTDLPHLHQALCASVRQAGDAAQLALIQAHPDLVGRAALAGTLTPQSNAEQASAGLHDLTKDEIATFQRFNQAYRDRFGFPFIICARLNKKEAILAAFPKRLDLSRQQEIQSALAEIFKIARLRLEDLVAP